MIQTLPWHNESSQGPPKPWSEWMLTIEGAIPVFIILVLLIVFIIIDGSSSSTPRQRRLFEGLLVTWCISTFVKGVAKLVVAAIDGWGNDRVLEAFILVLIFMVVVSRCEQWLVQELRWCLSRAEALRLPRRGRRVIATVPDRRRCRRRGWESRGHGRFEGFNLVR